MAFKGKMKRGGTLEVLKVDLGMGRDQRVENAESAIKISLPGVLGAQEVKRCVSVVVCRIRVSPQR